MQENAVFNLSNLRYQILPNGSLSITNIVLQDQGVYHCTATNPLLGVSRTSEPTQLTVVGMFKIFGTPCLKVAPQLIYWKYGLINAVDVIIMC